jgi:dihydroorotate dehydrogenase electron transfer subunit
VTLTREPPRVTAPFGRRTCAVVANHAAGSYRLVEVLDPDGPVPRPGQFYMLAAERLWGGEGGRPHLARAFSVCHVRNGRLGFLVDAIGPGTVQLAELEPGEGLALVGPLGSGFSMPAAGGRPLLVAGGVGLAPLVILADTLRERGYEPRVLAGFRSARQAEAAGLAGDDVLVTTDDGSNGERGFVTELLGRELSEEAAVYACGPAPMLDRVRRLCAQWSVPAELALEEAMACGFGACFGCVVRTRAGYRRICVDGPVVAAADLDDSWLEH